MLIRATLSLFLTTGFVFSLTPDIPGPQLMHSDEPRLAIPAYGVVTVEDQTHRVFKTLELPESPSSIPAPSLSLEEDASPASFATEVPEPALTLMAGLSVLIFCTTRLRR